MRPDDETTEPLSGRGADVADRGDGPTVMARLALRPGEPVRGSLDTAGHAVRVFCGWIDFMSAINALRNHPVSPASVPDPSDTSREVPAANYFVPKNS